MKSQIIEGLVVTAIWSIVAAAAWLTVPVVCAQSAPQCDVPWPAEISKADLEAWYSTATPGEAKAVSQAVNEVFCWRGNPNNGWFGASITPSRVQGVARDACRHYNVAELRLLNYKLMREYVPPCLPDSHFDNH